MLAHFSVPTRVETDESLICERAGWYTGADTDYVRYGLFTTPMASRWESQRTRYLALGVGLLCRAVSTKVAPRQLKLPTGRQIARQMLFRISYIVQLLKLFCQRCVMVVEEENPCERLHF